MKKESRKTIIESKKIKSFDITATGVILKFDTGDSFNLTVDNNKSFGFDNVDEMRYVGSVISIFECDERIIQLRLEINRKGVPMWSNGKLFEPGTSFIGEIEKV